LLDAPESDPVAALKPVPTMFAEPETYVFRPAVFRPAVFIPAHPPQHANVEAAVTPAVAAASFPGAVVAPDKDNDEGDWSRPLARIGEELVAWMKTVVSAAVYATLIVTFGFQVARVEGQSMIPTLQDQDRLIVNKAVYRIHPPQIGDVVMLYYPEDPDKSFVKRVIAEANDTIRSDNGRVYRNDVLLNDDFIPEEYRSYDSWGPYVVPKGYYFVMGDHRNNSLDSRAWGNVPMKYIIGKVQIRWWPIDHAKIF
jgi:signal peptidase I